MTSLSFHIRPEVARLSAPLAHPDRPNETEADWVADGLPRAHLVTQPLIQVVDDHDGGCQCRMPDWDSMGERWDWELDEAGVEWDPTIRF